MTLPTSGNPPSFSQVNVELGYSSTAQISMNCTAFRTLFRVSSGAIGMSSGFGKSKTSVPGAPTIGTATATSSTSASITFTAPTCTGGASITGYQAISSPGSITGTSASSPITVSGLTTGTSYTFQVRAQNSVGYGSYSGSSNSVQPGFGSAVFTTAGTYCWTVPAGVTSFSAVAIGGGNGGTNYSGTQAGMLAYTNNQSTTPGTVWRVIVGAGGNPSTCAHGCGHSLGSYSAIGKIVCCCGNPVLTSITVRAWGGGANCSNPGTGTAYYRGGTGTGTTSGGAGTAGYSGLGGIPGTSGSGACVCYGIPANWSPTAGQAGCGGGGGGGGGTSCLANVGSSGGGGTGLYGRGSNGAGGTAATSQTTAGGAGGGGSGGSNGVAGGYRNSHSNGGAYGGGGGGTWVYSLSISGGGGYGGSGGVRIVWPGNVRLYPATCVGTP